MKNTRKTKRGASQYLASLGCAPHAQRNLTPVQPDNFPHIGLVGDTYTVTVTGEQTAGHFCVLDFILIEGEMEATFRGKESMVRAGDTLNIPANALPRDGRILRGGGGAGGHAHAPPPKLDEKEQAAFIEKVKALGPKYRTELLREA